MIKTVIIPEQEKQYHDAVVKQDWYVANLFYRPPIYIPWEVIRGELRIKALTQNILAEQQRIEEMDPKLLQLETELRLGYKEPLLKRKPRITFVSWLLGRYRKS